MSDTPRTDSGCEYDQTTTDDVIEWARQLERELNASNQHIKRLKKAGDQMYDFISPSSPCMSTSELENLLHGWDDAKIGKEAKP